MVSDVKAGIGTKEHTDFLPFFGGCGDLGVEAFGVDSAGGFVGFGVDSLRCLVAVLVVFCWAG